jgi:anti-sigma B factor antagonist
LSSLERHLSFSAVVSSEDDRVVFTLHGDLDAPNVETLSDLLDAVLHDGVHHLVVDLGGVGFVSLAGLFALVRAHRDARRHRGSLVLRSPSPALLRMIDASGHADELTVVAGDTRVQLFVIEGFIDGTPADLHWTDGLQGSDAALTRARLLADLGMPVGTGQDLGEITATTAEAFPGGFLTAIAAFDTVTEAWFDLPVVAPKANPARPLNRSAGGPEALDSR